MVNSWDEAISPTGFPQRVTRHMFRGESLLGFLWNETPSLQELSSTHLPHCHIPHCLLYTDVYKQGTNIYIFGWVQDRLATDMCTDSIQLLISQLNVNSLSRSRLIFPILPFTNRVSYYQTILSLAILSIINDQTLFPNTFVSHWCLLVRCSWVRPSSDNNWSYATYATEARLHSLLVGPLAPSQAMGCLMTSHRLFPGNHLRWFQGVIRGTLFEYLHVPYKVQVIIEYECSSPNGWLFWELWKRLLLRGLNKQKKETWLFLLMFYCSGLNQGHTDCLLAFNMVMGKCLFLFLNKTPVPCQYRA